MEETEMDEDNRRHLSPATRLSGGRYRIERLVAAGDMGAVYRAIDERSNRPCAVKEMLDEFQTDTERNQAVERFGREATLLLDLNHACIARVRDFFVQDGKHYLVMDFIEGRTLGDLLEKEGNIPGLNGAHGVSEARARSWAQQLCSVLAYLHRQTPPVIFRDLKPSNVMVTDRDEIKLIDFGIARTFQAQRQMTVGYAPPEQLHGNPEPRSDLYALGATIHRILTHYDAANSKLNIFAFPPIRTLRPDISPAFEQIIMKALSVSIEQRWSSAADMERAINNLPAITAPAAAPSDDQPTMQPPGMFFPSPAPLPEANPGALGEEIDAVACSPPQPISGYHLPAPSRMPSPPVTAGTTDPGGASLSAAPVQPRSSAQEHLQFSAFHPRVVPIGDWNTLLVYTYIESALQAIHADAARFKDELGPMPSEVDGWASRPLTRGLRIRVIPTLQGVTFNPPQIGFNWVEDWHSAKFRFQADNRLTGTTASGEVAIYAGPLLVAVLKVSLRFVEQSLQPRVVERRNQDQVSTSLYRKIFTSYSHADTPVVLALRNVYKALGDESFIDSEHLRSGQDWNEALMRQIDSADIFQLFWSDTASRSRYVEQEWRHAFRHPRGEGFIRPVYWKKPLIPPPAELSQIHFQYIELAHDIFSPVIQGPLGDALAYLNTGHIEPAFAALQQAYQLEPSNAVVHKLYGQVFVRRQPPQPDIAIQAYNRSLQIDGNDPETHRLLGDVYLSVRRLPAQAIAPYTQALRLNPRDFEAHRGLAKSYEETRQFAPALHEYQEAATIDPKRPDIHYSIGQLAQGLGQLSLAERAFGQVLTINPADHATRFLLAQVYERQGKLEDAWRECTFVVNATPSNDAARVMLQRLRSQLRR